MLQIKRMAFDLAPELTGYADHNIFQTLEWVNFVAVTQNAEPVIATVMEGSRIVGRFTGLIITKYGIKILGSPFHGWSTYYMGFNLEPSVSQIDALVALKEFAFKDLKCIHLEISDRNITPDQLKAAGYLFQSREKVGYGFEIDLTKNEEELLQAMSSSCRWSYRKSIKSGIIVEASQDINFADDFYSQLIDVYAKQGLVPSYSIERVRKLIECLGPTGELLLLRAKTKEGSCVATGIFPALNDTMYFWGGASYRSHQKLCPNEAIQLYAIKYWKSKGIKRYNMGGGGAYKRKYGGNELYVPWGRKSKVSGIDTLRNFGRSIFKLSQGVRGLIARISGE